MSRRTTHAGRLTVFRALRRYGPGASIQERVRVAERVGRGDVDLEAVIARVVLESDRQVQGHAWTRWPAAHHACSRQVNRRPVRFKSIRTTRREGAAVPREAEGIAGLVPVKLQGSRAAVHDQANVDTGEVTPHP